jgi:uncharacterized protein YegP (UPF0339 family)
MNASAQPEEITARFDVVRTNAGYHARFVAANGEIVWTTEVYTQLDTALDAIDLLRGNALGVLEVRRVDEGSGS